MGMKERQMERVNRYWEFIDSTRILPLGDRVQAVLSRATMGMTVSHLGRMIGTTRTIAEGILHNLEKHGLVEVYRHRAPLKDNQEIVKKMWRLTEKGRVAAADIVFGLAEGKQAA